MAHTAEDFTAEDFERIWAIIDSGRAIPFEDYWNVSAALKIASAVMRPGVIETVIHEMGADADYMTNEDIAAAIRAALMDVKP